MTDDKIETLGTDTSEEHSYAVCRCIDGKEVFFEHKGISYGRGRSWTITPEQRTAWGLESPVETYRGKSKTTKRRIYRRKKRIVGMGEFELLNTPEFLTRLQELLKARDLKDLPEDAIVSRCQVAPDGFNLHRHEASVFPYETRDLNVLVLSSTYDVVRGGYPSLVD